jgi:hypothetical protein
MIEFEKASSSVERDARTPFVEKRISCWNDVALPRHWHGCRKLARGGAAQAARCAGRDDHFAI